MTTSSLFREVFKHVKLPLALNAHLRGSRAPAVRCASPRQPHTLPTHNRDAHLRTLICWDTRGRRSQLAECRTHFSPQPLYTLYTFLHFRTSCRATLYHAGVARRPSPSAPPCFDSADRGTPPPRPGVKAPSGGPSKTLRSFSTPPGPSPRRAPPHARTLDCRHNEACHHALDGHRQQRCRLRARCDARARG